MDDGSVLASVHKGGDDDGSAEEPVSAKNVRMKMLTVSCASAFLESPGLRRLVSFVAPNHR